MATESHIENDFNKLNARHEQQQFDEDCARGWANIVFKYPHVCDHEANLRVAKEYTAPLPVSLQTFELLLDNPEFADRLNYRAVEDQKNILIMQIINLLRPIRPANNLVVEKGRLRFYNLLELRNRLAELQSKQAQAKLPVSELRQIVKPVPQLAPRVPLEITRAAIKAADSDTIRSWNRRYGIEQINDRLYGRS